MKQKSQSQHVARAQRACMRSRDQRERPERCRSAYVAGSLAAWSVSALLLVLLAGPAQANEPIAWECDTTYLESIASCTTSDWLTADVEFMYLGYYQEGGVTDSPGNPVSLDWQFAPRFVVALQAPEGLGVRARYWYYDGSASNASGNSLGVEAYYLDGELYQGFKIGCHTDLEYSLGLRYQDFEQYTTFAAASSALLGGNHGFGGVLGLQAKRDFLIGKLYARGRYALTVGDAQVDNINLTTGSVTTFNARDNTFAQTELALGYEFDYELGQWGVATFHCGAEWQNWTNVAMADTTFGGLGNDDVLEDAGFAGLTFGVGVRW